MGRKREGKGMQIASLEIEVVTDDLSSEYIEAG